MTVLYWTDYVNKEKYQKDKDESLQRRDAELTRRESIVVDKEICFRELTKLRTIQASALDILKMYTIPEPISTSPISQVKGEAFSPKINDAQSVQSVQSVQSDQSNQSSNNQSQQSQSPIIGNSSNKI